MQNHMSAIFGIVNKKRRPIEPYSLNVMLSAIAHRATDGKDTWMNGIVGFGHCLLKVYPQQEHEHCPLTAYNCTITADVRLDNRSELAALLGIDRTLLNTVSDPEVILRSYKHWGEDCVNHLEGEFAFAIWDANNQKLFAATDHIGFRPFFYYDSQEQFIFCSEMKGIVAAKPQPNYFNEESLVEYFYRKGIPNATYNKEVFALCGGNVLTLQDGKMAYRKYWNLESTGKYRFKKDEDWYGCTRELLYNAIEKRLNPDLPMGITLSGGLDSTSIACILSELLMKKNKPLYAFSSVLPLDHVGIERDERHYIEIVGRHCPNIIQTYVEAPGVGPFSDLEEAFKIEESFPNSFFYMDKALLNAATEKNARSLYTGFGGDYWFSWKGNSVVYQLMRQGDYKMAFHLIHQFSNVEEQSFFRTFRSMYVAQTAWYEKVRSILKKEQINWQEYSPLHDFFRSTYSSRLNVENSCSNTEGVQGFVNRGIVGRIISLFYNRNSTFAMDSSVPLFDKELLELLGDMPINLFVKGGRRRGLIRNVMDGINPPEINIRTDKLPYAPGYVNRIKNDRELVNRIINDSGSEFVCAKYINKQIIVDHFDDMNSFAGFTPPDKIVGLRIAQAVTVCALLGQLESIYCFE
jgi:asparagine synthase (glutamine-hydrolysing)